VSVSLNLNTAAPTGHDGHNRKELKTMCLEKLARYVVDVPQGLTISEAVARHRENTGHGGMCVLRFAPRNEATASTRYDRVAAAA
jgi:hypothetical protein